MVFRWQQLRLPIAGWLVAAISYLAVSYWVLQRSVDRGGTLASWPAAVIALGWLLLLGAALMRNATRQRQSQDELRAIQKRLQLVLSATPGISYSTLLADGK